jgi:hypothetical protein
VAIFDQVAMRRSDLAERNGWWRRAACALAVLAACWLHDGISLATMAAGAAARAASPQLLQSFPAAPYTFDLTQEACFASGGGDASREAECAFGVNLVAGSKVLDRVRIGEPGCGPATPTSITLALGADRDAKAWSSSDEDCDMAVAARTVALGPRAAALLITALHGVESSHRSHWLYLARTGKVETPWSHAEDSAGGHWTTATVLPGSGGAQEVAFIDIAREAPGVPAKVTAQRLQVDPTTGRVTATPLPAPSYPLFVLQVGRFARASEATKLRQSCLADLVVLRAGLFRGVKLPAFFLGAVFAQRPDAEAAVTAFATCAQIPETAIVEYPAAGGSG